MNRQFLSVLLCALVSSSLGHDYLRAHELKHVAKHQSRTHPGIHHFRDNIDNCAFVCPSPKPSAVFPGGIRFLINKEYSVVAIANHNASVAISVDLKENIVVLFNGKAGTAVLIDLKTEEGIHWPEGSCDQLWVANKSSFLVYFLGLGSLADAKNFSGGQSFKIKSPPKEVVAEVTTIISLLGQQLAERIKLNPKLAISFALVISKIIAGTLGGSLSILIEKSEGTEYIIAGGLLDFTILLTGLASFSTKIVGGLEAIVAADVNFKLSLLLAASSGLEVLVVLLSQAAAKIDFSNVLGPVFKTPETLYETIVAFEGGLYGGAFGIEAIIYNSLLLTSKKISLSAFIDVIIQVGASGLHISKERLTSSLDAFIAILQTQVDTFKSSTSCRNILSFVNQIRGNNFSIGGVNVSAIINLIIENSGKISLNLIIGILLKLSPIANVGELLGTLYLRLVFFIVSGQGVAYVLRLFPDIGLHIDFSSTTSIIVQILKGVNVAKILPPILSLNIIGAIKILPVLGPIFVGLTAALRATGGTQQQLEGGLKGTQVISTLFGWIRLGLSLGGGSEPSGTVRGLVFIGGGADISTNISIDGKSVGSNTPCTDSISSSSPRTGAKATVSDSVVVSEAISEKVTGAGSWAIEYKNHHRRKHA